VSILIPHTTTSQDELLSPLSIYPITGYIYPAKALKSLSKGNADPTADRYVIFRLRRDRAIRVYIEQRLRPLWQIRANGLYLAYALERPVFIWYRGTCTSSSESGFWTCDFTQAETMAVCAYTLQSYVTRGKPRPTSMERDSAHLFRYSAIIPYGCSS
jgi:hypothetical protein